MCIFTMHGKQNLKGVFFRFQLSVGFCTFGHFKNVQFSFFQNSFRNRCFVKTRSYHNAVIWFFQKNI